MKSTRHTAVSEKLQRRHVLIHLSRSPTSNISAWLRNKTVWKVALSLIVPHPLHVLLHNSAKLISHYTTPPPVQGVHDTLSPWSWRGSCVLSGPGSTPVQATAFLSLFVCYIMLYNINWHLTLYNINWHLALYNINRHLALYNIDTWRFIMLIDTWRFIILIDTWHFIILTLGAL